MTEKLKLIEVKESHGHTVHTYRVEGLVQAVDDDGRVHTLYPLLKVGVLEAAPDHSEPEVAVFTYEPLTRAIRFLHVRRGSKDPEAALRSVFPAAKA